MADISMCLNNKCPLKLECYRFNTKPEKVQSYSLFNYKRIGEKVACEYFIPSKKFSNNKKQQL